jgi:hypothetical protein
LTADTTYSYIVRAFINAPPQQSAWSNEAIVATVVLQPPTNLTAIAAYITTPSNRPEVILHWTNNSLGQQGIDVERKHPTPANPYPSYVQIATAGPTDSTFVDSGPGLFCDGRPYYYRIKAYNAGSSTLYSNEAWATPSAFPPGQNPTNLIFEPGVNGFTVTWSDYITTAIPVKNYLVEGWSTPPSDTAFPDTVITIPVTDVTTGETTITAVVTLSYPTTELWYTRVIAQASNGQFSLYATNDSNPSLDYASGDIFLNSPTSSSGGGGGGPLGPLAIGISGLLTWLKLRKRR